MRRLVWPVLVALLIVDILLLIRVSRAQTRYRALWVRSAKAAVAAAFTAEQEAVVLRSATFPDIISWPVATDGMDPAVGVVLLASADDCHNCIVDEVEALNDLATDREGHFIVHGVIVDEEAQVKVFLDNLVPAPAFPVVAHPLLAELEFITTPSVLLVRATDRRIVAVHKPIPEDTNRRDAFYVQVRAYADR